MKAGDIFRASEMSALAGAGAGGGEISVGSGGFVSNVQGKDVKKRKKFLCNLFQNMKLIV